MKLGSVFAGAFVAFAFSACDSVPKPADGVGVSAATLTYKLPATLVKVGLDLTVVQCTPTVELKPVASITAPADASQDTADTFVIDGKNLESWNKTRNITVSLNDNGTIKSVNAGAADQTGNIITGVLSTALSIAKFAGSPSPSDGLGCTKSTAAALEQTATLTAGVNALKAQLGTAELQLAQNATKHADTSALQRDIQTYQNSITALASDIADIQASPALHVSLPAQTIALGVQGGFIRWDDSAFKAVFNYAPPQGLPSQIGEALQLGYCFTPKGASGGPTACKSESDVTKVAGKKAPGPSKARDCGADAGCRRTLVFRDPVDAELTVVAVGSGFSEQQNKPLQQQTIPVPQWGEYSYISLDVAFGENRTISLALDGYGHKTSLGWNSDARAANIVSAASNAATSGTGIIGTLQGADLAVQTAEVNKLTTQQKLNQLKKCQAILDAGGFVCPSS